MSTKRFLFVALALGCLQHPSAAIAQTFITAWGGYANGSGPGAIATPDGVAVGGSGDVYVVDETFNRISVFTSTGTFLRQWSTPTSCFNIAVDASDNVYVTGAGTIYKYTSNGALVTQWTAPGGLGIGLAVDGAGNVYVYEAGGLSVFTASGVFVRQLHDVGGGRLAVDAEGNIYVVLSFGFGNRVQKFANTGTLLAEWGSGDESSADGEFFGPTCVALDPAGAVYVVDNGNSRVQKFTPDGVFVTKWGSFGAAPGQFVNPIGIAVDGNGDIYVADTNNSRIQKFSFAPTPVQGITWGALKSRYRGAPGAAQPAPQGR
jgi:sugar lactone lactonase YvrE